ncbi:late competence development ComFB family protein [Anabaena catenula]|uniref:Late competence development ComFB family protein n=1 Tax=Anabaena catenula FACHB-362 TaxID=2692877 RepID=A0ABR8J458_9NOST|nr:late competence development ComFB family protein [Anabaena catenula]MBD2692385.1 late competence development ComFB family protein [Anabaena catenula FACHB-362]
MSNFNSSFNVTVQAHKEHSFIKNSRNVMEMLVVEEVEKQIQSLPLKTANYIKASEVVAYALNRLPSLYATSKRGWQRQWHHGKTELYQQISTAVRQGMAAVQRDPLRINEPLNFPEDQAAQTALEGLKVLLQREDISWDNLNNVVEQTLLNTLKGNITWSNGRSDNQKFDWEKHRQ